MINGDGAAHAGSLEWWAEREERLLRRRPRAEGLTIEAIIAAALGVIDDHGLHALTMRRLAEELSTASASLYRHVASRDELVVLVIDHVIGEVEYPPEDLDGRRRVEWLAHELRRVLLVHPNVISALTASPLVGPNARRGTRVALESLLAAGFAPEVAAPAYLALIDYVFGSVSFDTGGDMARRSTRSSDLHWSAVSSAGTLDAPPAEVVFRFGLATFLDGLELHRT
jgi:AcrR family transcriptional regulator